MSNAIIWEYSQEYFRLKMDRIIRKFRLGGKSNILIKRKSVLVRNLALKAVVLKLGRNAK